MKIMRPAGEQERRVHSSQIYDGRAALRRRRSRPDSCVLCYCDPRGERSGGSRRHAAIITVTAAYLQRPILLSRH